MAEQVKALVFDVFGTVADWRGTIIREGEALGRGRTRGVDWPLFADRWRREGYLETIAAINAGKEPWLSVDEMHRRQLRRLMDEYGISGLSEGEIAHFNQVWHRLEPWLDVAEGLARLKRKFVISTLSNGDFALLTNMGKHADLPWDCIMASELFGKYKPNREVYQGAARLLAVEPDEVMMVAAHVQDLLGARAAGLRTAFVSRPLEWGSGGPTELPAGHGFDITATDFIDLANQLNA
ncbi:MAG: haloacid dehalogenase type II [Chloroflexota bacterium]